MCVESVLGLLPSLSGLTIYTRLQTLPWARDMEPSGLPLPTVHNYVHSTIRIGFWLLFFYLKSIHCFYNITKVSFYLFHIQIHVYNLWLQQMKDISLHTFIIIFLFLYMEEDDTE